MTGPLEPGSRKDGPPPDLPTNRSFGWVFTGVFVLVGLWSVWKQETPWWWAFGVAGAFLATALMWPQRLGPLNRIWMSFGHLLHRVISPVILAVLYFGVFTPMGLFMRAVGKRPLQPRGKEATSYWVFREPPGPAPETLRHPY